MMMTLKPNVVCYYFTRHSLLSCLVLSCRIGISTSSTTTTKEGKGGEEEKKTNPIQVFQLLTNAETSANNLSYFQSTSSSMNVFSAPTVPRSVGYGHHYIQVGEHHTHTQVGTKTNLSSFSLCDAGSFYSLQQIVQ